MFRMTAALLGLALFACSGYAQDPAQAPAASQPTRAPTAQELLRRADQFVSRIPELLRAGRSAEVTQQAYDTLRDLESLLQADAENSEALVVLAELLIYTRDFDRARRTFKQVLDKEPANYRANLGLGRQYLDSHYPRQATGYLETAARVAPPKAGQKRCASWQPRWPPKESALGP
jgi:thioredoxin-like negative regulator of GroEL